MPEKRKLDDQTTLALSILKEAKQDNEFDVPDELISDVLELFTDNEIGESKNVRNELKKIIERFVEQ